MANLTGKERFLYFKNKTSFISEKIQENINPLAIVFIEDSSELWSHNHFFSCANLTSLLTKIVHNDTTGEDEEVNLFGGATTLNGVINYLKTLIENITGGELSLQSLNNAIDEINDAIESINDDITSINGEINDLKQIDLNLQTAINGKQDKVTEGFGIDITDNTVNLDIVLGDGLAWKLENGSNTNELICTLDSSLFEVVSSLEAVTAPKSSHIYIVANGNSNKNNYTEWIYNSGLWELLGDFDSEIDFILSEDTIKALLAKESLTEDEKTMTIEDALKKLKSLIVSANSSLDDFKEEVEETYLKLKLSLAISKSLTGDDTLSEGITVEDALALFAWAEPDA